VSNEIEEMTRILRYESVEAARVRVLRKHIRTEPRLNQEGCVTVGKAHVRHPQAFCVLCEETWPCDVAIIASEPNLLAEEF